jgi:predicted NBD/HSP70 family sugar kinase
MAVILGIDIGGSGIKGAPVDTATGKLTAERHRIATPEGARPDDVKDVVAELVRHFGHKGAVGVTFPGIVQHGVTLSAANVDKGWIGLDADKLFTDATGQNVTLINDADAAGLAEAKFGAGAGVAGTVLVLTFGTGIGSALIYDGVLVPNTELGHLWLRARRPELETVGRACQQIPATSGTAVFARPVYYRRRREQKGRQMANGAGAGAQQTGARRPAERRRNRRRGHDRRAPGEGQKVDLQQMSQAQEPFF